MTQDQHVQAVELIAETERVVPADQKERAINGIRVRDAIRMILDQRGPPAVPLDDTEDDDLEGILTGETAYWCEVGR